MAIVKAEQVFTTAAGFSEEEVAKIRAAAAGKTISFGRCKMSDERREKSEVAERMSLEYARGATADEVAGRHGMSRRQVFYLLRRERTQGTQATKATGWRERGLSWREVGRLLGVSHEAARQMAERKEDGGERMEEQTSTD